MLKIKKKTLLIQQWNNAYHLHWSLYQWTWIIVGLFYQMLHISNKMILNKRISCQHNYICFSYRNVCILFFYLCHFFENFYKINRKVDSQQSFEFHLIGNSSKVEVVLKIFKYILLKLLQDSKVNVFVFNVV